MILRDVTNMLKKKNYCQILCLLGFILKSSHRILDWNMLKGWYKESHESPFWVTSFLFSNYKVS